MRSGPGLSLHGHVPVQQPGGRQRDAARLPLRQRGPRGPAGRVRPDGVRLRRPGASTRGTATGPDDRRLSTYQGFPPGFEVGLDLPDEQDAVARLARAASATTSPPTATPRWPPSPTGPPSTASRPSSATRSSPGSNAGTGPGSRTPATGVPTRPTPQPATGRRPTTPTPYLGSSAPRHATCRSCGNLAAQPAPEDERALRALQAQYFGMISDVDAQLGRVLDTLRSLRHVGRHAASS